MTENIEYKELDFEVIQEPWNKYQLEDGTFIKNRYVLVKFLLAKLEDGGIDIKVNRNVIASVLYANLELKGDPTEIPTPDKWRDYIEEESLKYKTIHEEWNEYRLFNGEEDFTLRVKSTVTNISRTSLIRKDGFPIFLVDSTEQSILKKN